MKRKRKCIRVENPSMDNEPYFTGSVNDQKILTDLRGKQWKLGPMIGSGGFGEIHLGSDKLYEVVNKNNAEFMIKLESFTSASLFNEMYFYANAGRKEYVEEWKENHQLQSLGMPYYFGNGSFYHGARRYRFIVLPRYGSDLQTKFLDQIKTFSIKTAFTIAISVMDVLEYIHHRGYVHSDIKAANLVLDREDSNVIYLIDYGLAYKIYNGNRRHKKLEHDRRKAHDGTIEFTSRDAHIGAHSRRSDLEIVGYNIIKWVTGKLPWEFLSKEEQVSDMKTHMMKNVTDFLTQCFEGCDSSPPESLARYLNYINTLKFKDEPDYNYCRLLFRNAIQEAGYIHDGNMSFNDSRAKKKRKLNDSNKENDQTRQIQLDRTRKILAAANHRITRKSTPITAKFDWTAILAGNPEKNNTSLPMFTSPVSPVSDFIKEDSESDEDDSADFRGLDNPTPLMKDIMKRLKIQPTNVNVVDFSALCGPSFNDSTPITRRSCCFRQKKKRLKLSKNRPSPLQKPTKCKPILMSPRNPFGNLRNERRVRFPSPLLGRGTDQKYRLQQSKLLRCSSKNLTKNEKSATFVPRRTNTVSVLENNWNNNEKNTQCSSTKLLLREKVTGSPTKLLLGRSSTFRKNALQLSRKQTVGNGQNSTRLLLRNDRSLSRNNESGSCNSQTSDRKRASKKFRLKERISFGYRRNLRILSSTNRGFRHFLR